MSSTSAQRWTRATKGSSYPSEYVIRIFRGSYPRLNLDKKSFRGKKICDISCGDGRDLEFLKSSGFDVYGTEISEGMANLIRKNSPRITPKKIKVGTNDAIPFKDGFFDYLLSWNAAYYFGEEKNFDAHVREFSRTLKKGGVLVMSIPKKTSFIYKGSEEWKPGYQIIKNDPFKVRNGDVLRMFQDEHEIKRVFSTHFKDFIFGSIEDDCFGLNYHWHLVICKKK